MSQTVDELYLLGEVFEFLEAVVTDCGLGSRRNPGDVNIHKPETV